MFEVLEPGLLSTIQDGGRPGFPHLGVPSSGACDRWSLAVANLLLGNPPDAAALELTLLGPELAVLEPCEIALAGADLGAVVVGEGRRLAPGASHPLERGTRLRFAGQPRGARAVRAGVRAYLAVPGGFDVPNVQGSRSTCLAGGFGGLDGRALRPGDRLRPAAAGSGTPGRQQRPPNRRWPDGLPDPLAPGPLRLLPGPAPLAGSALGAFEALLAGSWRVGVDADRTGLRLDGPALPVDETQAGRLVSEGLVIGAVQVPPGRRPLVLLADAPTVGGYSVPAIVIGADLPRLAQLGPTEPVTFRGTTREAARSAAMELQRALEDGAARLASP